MSKILLVGLGGFVGSALRYWLGGVVQAAAGGSTFPFGTLAVNVTGCFAIGFLSQLGETQGALSPGSRALLVVGLLGGFTTFSAFGNETLNLLRDSQRLAALANISANVLAGLGAVWLGRLAAHAIWR